MFNVNNITLSINGINLVSLHCAKYLCVYIDDAFNWKSHISFTLTKCSQKIGMFKKVLSLITNDVPLLYYNAFIKSCFAYCFMFWINNMRSGQYKLIDKVNHLISLLAKCCNLTVDDYMRKTSICDVTKTSKLQCLLFIYNVTHNLNYLPFFCHL